MLIWLSGTNVAPPVRAHMLSTVEFLLDEVQLQPICKVRRLISIVLLLGCFDGKRVLKRFT